MNTLSPKSSAYLFALAAVILGVLFDHLFFEKHFGVSFFIFEAVAVVLTLWFSTRLQHSFRPALWLITLALLFAAMVAVRASAFLTLLNVLASFGLLLLATNEFLKKRIVNFRIPDYLVTIVITPFKILRRALQALAFISRPSQQSSTALRRVVIGIIMALPFLILFGVLFASADLAFKQLIDSVFTFHISDEFFAHVILIVGTFVVSLGLFAYLFNIPSEKDASETAAAKPERLATDRKIEVGVFLWLIAGLFAVFLIFQIAYLFGGAINISQGNFTYAEYARKGFGELIVAAFFTLAILLIMDAYTKRNSYRLKWFTIPSMVLTVEVLVIVISAFKRLMLYQEAYGLTTLRFYVSACIIFLGVIFIILAIKLWREKEDRFFAFGALVSMIVFLAAFNLLNPEAFIAKKNLDRFEQTGNIDAYYVGNLSADAIPAVLKSYDRLNEEDKATIQQLLVIKKAELEKEQSDWQSYNVSKQKAIREIGDAPVQGL